MRIRRIPSLPHRSRQEWLELADRYFEADTTLEEEAQLRHFAVSPEAVADPAFDELRAVMAYSSHASLGLLKVSATQSAQTSLAMLWPTMGRIAVAAVLVLSVGLGAWSYQRHVGASTDKLQAYVYGEKLTSPDAVMMQLRAVMKEVCDDEADPTVESQMRDVLDNL